MLRLMQEHYDAVDPVRFASDLQEKDRVVLLTDQDRVIQGFTTFLAFSMRHPQSGQALRVLYSGDTVIHREHWGTQALAFEWIDQAGREKARHPDRPLLWFLISKGPRTYRYLSVFSRVYWPHHARPTPAHVQALMDALAGARFGTDYRPGSGVVRFPVSRGHLRAGLAPSSQAGRRRAEVDFFLSKNPGYRNGDELVCLCELAAENLKPLSRRLFERGLRDGDASRLEPTA